MGSSGHLGGKLVIAQDAAQSLADLCMQRLCVLLQGIYEAKSRIAIRKLGFPLEGGWDGTHWPGRPLRRTLDSHVASRLRAW